MAISTYNDHPSVRSVNNISYLLQNVRVTLGMNLPLLNLLDLSRIGKRKVIVNIINSV